MDNERNAPSSDEELDMIISEYEGNSSPNVEGEEMPIANTDESIGADDESVINDTAVNDEIDGDSLENSSEEKDEVPNKKKKKKKRKKSRRNKVIGSLVLAITIIAASITLSVVIIYAGMDLFGIGKSEIHIDIEVPQNSSTRDIAEILKESDVVKYPSFFRFISYLQKADGMYQYGVFEVSPSMSYEEIIAILQDSKAIKNTVQITIPEGYNIKQIAEELEENNICEADEFLDYVDTANLSYKFEEKISNDPLKFYQKEGFLFPDTYIFYENERIENILTKFYSTFDKKITDEMYDKMQEKNLSLNQVMTLASMVQAESANKEQMRMVASVFINRFNNSLDFPKMQSDPTKKYVNEVIKSKIKMSSYDLYQKVFDSYDTYVGVGLPPGPICNPGIDAIEAVLDPADTDYYFFCHNIKTREIYYAKTNDEHEKNLKAAGLS
ncbi:MAG: endolytic transglycosylase MltG [Clostridiales bacterium]|nr:endolytic transglycosylase MltG [Clostridiales bacterium]